MPIKRTGGDRAKVTAAVRNLGQQEGKVGWFESAKYANGAPVAGVAYVQEHGSAARSIPPRPYFRPTVAERKTAWAKTAGDVSRAVLEGHLSPDASTEALCLAAEGDVRKAISKLTAPALSPLTILARKERQIRSRQTKGQMQGGLTGKDIGRLAARLDQGPQDVSGVSTKPLVDSGLMLATLSSQVNKK